MSVLQRILRYFARPRAVLAIDISSYQRDVDWRAVSSEPVPLIAKPNGIVRLAIIKTTEGATHQNRHASAQALGAAAAGLAVQYYHFARPDLGERRRGAESEWASADATAEAAAFIGAMETLTPPRVVRFRGGATASVWLDLEVGAPNVDRAAMQTWVETWASLVESAGYPVGIYSGKRWSDVELADVGRLRVRADGSLRPWWAPDYGADTGQLPGKPYGAERRTPAAFHPPAIWQFTSRGRVPGVKAVVDLNVAYVEEDLNGG